MEKETKNNLKKVQLFVAVSLLLFSTLFLFRTPGITGHVTADFRSQPVDITIEQSQVYSIKTSNPEPVSVSSLRMSGITSGGGSVEIYVQDQAGQKYLIYKNVREKERGLPGITGMAVARAEEPVEESLILMVPESVIEWESELSLSQTEEFVSGPFNNKCIDTCFMEMVLSEGASYNLIFMVEPGTKVNINKIIYTLKDENI
jgi:hypothetical protein